VPRDESSFVTAESISEAESAVIAVLWDNGPATAEDVSAALAAPRGWHDSTVKTLLGRLLKKGAVQARKVAGASSTQCWFRWTSSSATAPNNVNSS
jgi:predicted transcriptional regulator